mmetsp:Transcript_54217/g.87593  ORF Transcript_54217/g.87593 Transcript_54217/m.87593 type:complete len:201 (-) Transcript_54217:116-718(-)
MAAPLLFRNALVLLGERRLVLLLFPAARLELRLEGKGALDLLLVSLALLGQIVQTLQGKRLRLVVASRVLDALHQSLMEHADLFLHSYAGVLNECLDLLHLGRPVGTGRLGRSHGGVVAGPQATPGPTALRGPRGTADFLTGSNGCSDGILAILQEHLWQEGLLFRSLLFRSLAARGRGRGRGLSVRHSSRGGRRGGRGG